VTLHVFQHREWELLGRYDRLQREYGFPRELAVLSPLGIFQASVFRLGRVNAVCVNVLRFRNLSSNSLVVSGLALVSQNRPDVRARFLGVAIAGKTCSVGRAGPGPGELT